MRGSRLLPGAVCVAAIGAIAASGCGSSKPAYCTDRSDLSASVKGLTNLSDIGGLSGLQTQLTKIQSDANSVVSSAKSDFPTETSAISSSVDALSSAIKALPSNPSVGQLVALGPAAANVVNAVKSFSDATSSKCS